MVVLAASIVTKTGKALVSRQYMDMSRIRVEGLLAAFPKLVGSGKQHTYVETENVRYVYQPMETLYLLLVTNKQSNILEDLETLRLLSKLVPEYVQSLDEDGVRKSAFELIFAFDEVISLGHKENVTIQQVKTYTEMESHEEKLHKMIIQSKINDTKDVMKRKAMEIDKTKVDKRPEKPPFPSMGSSSSFGGGGGGGGFDDGPGGGPFGGGGGGVKGSGSRPDLTAGGFGEEPSARPAAPRAGGPSKGMQLGKSGKTNMFMEALKNEGDLLDLESSKPSAVAAAAPAMPQEAISIAVEERVVCQLKKDGGLDNLEVQGTMALEVASEDDAFIRVKVAQGENKGFQFKTHPNIDKALHASGQLGLKDPNRPFPTGSALGILKWRMQTREEDLVPLSINCWPSVSGGESYVSIEYEATEAMDLQQVRIAIPIPPVRDPPTVNSCDGDYRYDSRQCVLLWEIDLVDKSNRSGSMEFVVPASDSDGFFPIEVSFSSRTTFCDVQVLDVVKTADGTPVKYAITTGLAVDSYTVV